MAVRTITTRIALEGETQFRQAMATVNSALRTNKSEMSLLEATFKGQANTLEFLTKKNKLLNQDIDQQKEKIRALEQAVKDSATIYGENSKQVNNYQAQLNRAKIGLLGMNEALAENEKYLEEAKNSADGTAKSIDEFGNAVKQSLAWETQFKQGIDTVNTSLRTVRSEISLSEATFKGQANTLAALTEKHNLLTQALALQKEQVKTLEQAVKDSAAAYGDDSKATQELQQQLNHAKSELVGTDRALQDTSRYLEEAKNNADGTAKSIDEFGNATKSAGNSVTTLAGALKAAGVAMGVREIAKAIRDCVDASVEFESAMASFNKVAKLSDEELAGMSEQIRTLSTEMPATTTEIAQVAEAAARLGIEKDHIIEFTEVMLNLGNVSDLSADAAATALARFANIAGTSSDNYERLGSVIVALGNNFATSESEITELSSRLASAGTLAGLTEPQIMALAAAMSSVGIQAEAGGTAMTQTLTAVEKAVTSGGKNLEQFAQIAGMSSSQFAEAWQGDPMTAITAFIGGLGQLDEQGESATQVLEELGLSGIRQSNMLKSLALAYDTLASAQETANIAWKDNTELAATATAFYDTTQAKMTMAANAANNLKIAVGDALLPALNALAEGVVPVIEAAETFVRDNPRLIQNVENLIALINLFTSSLSAALNIYNDLAARAKESEGALSEMWKLLEAINPGSGIDAGITALRKFIDFIVPAKEKTEELADASEDLSDGLDRTAEAAIDASDGLDEVGTTAEGAVSSMEDLSAAAQELEDATLYLAGSVDTLSSALEEQQEQGSLSLQTTLGLIDAGYAAALAVDEETGAVTLNREEYIRLANAKIEEQLATLQAQKAALESANALESEAAAARRDSSAYWDAAAAKLAKNAADKDSITSLDAQIAALKQAQNALGSYTGAVTTASRTTASASRQAKSEAQQAKTQAEEDLAAYKELKTELDRLKTLELVSEAEYYHQLAGYRSQYLTDKTNMDEYWKVTEQIFKYDKALADQEAALWAEQTDALVRELEERVKSLTDQQDKMESRLSGYGDLFEVKDNAMTLNSLQEQIDAIEAYEQALTRLKERGVSESLMDEVLGMDVDSATQYANQLLSMSEKQWEEYNSLWDEKQLRAAEVAEQFFRDQLDALESEYNDKLGDALDNLTDTSFGAGENTAQGLIDGLASMEAALYEQAQKMADNVSSILNGAGRIPSNSELAAAMSTERIAERYQGVTGQQLQNAVIGGVNALSTSAGNVVYPPVDVTLNLDGQTLARQQVDPMRQAFRERPETLDDT